MKVPHRNQILDSIEWARPESPPLGPSFVLAAASVLGAGSDRGVPRSLLKHRYDTMALMTHSRTLTGQISLHFRSATNVLAGIPTCKYRAQSALDALGSITDAHPSRPQSSKYSFSMIPPIVSKSKALVRG